MNSFAGIIGLGQQKESQGQAYQERLSRNFPSRFANAIIVNEDNITARGAFEASVLNNNANSSLYLDGEIYNHSEIARYLGIDASLQDTASLLHLLIISKGISAVERLNGQFLIIYIDNQTQQTYLLNDHAGIQQVFYYQHKDFLLFASDIKFLLQHPQCPKEIDWETSLKRPHPCYVLSSYNQYTTWFKDIHLLPEASIATIDNNSGKLSLDKFWNGLSAYPMYDINDRRTQADVMEEYMALLEDAVKIRCLEEGSAHSFLSGGLDSSAICALAAKYRDLKTYSIITQVTCLEGTTDICNDLSQDLKFDNTQFLVPFHEIVFNHDLWKQRVWRAESPVNHTDSLTKTLLHYAISKKDPSAKYILTGTGSDQYNGGLARWIIADQDNAGQSAAHFLKTIKDHELTKLISREDEGFWNMRHMLNRDFLSAVSGKQLEANNWMYYVKSAVHINTFSLLWDEVRASSSHGHVTRFPFLDHRFSEFIAGVPPHMHQELFFDKQILRTPSHKILPDYVINKPKAPSYIPEYDFRIKLLDFLTVDNDMAMVREAFGDLESPHPVINKKALVERIRNMRSNPHFGDWNNIVQLINLGLLEQLATKTERDLAYEPVIEQPLEVNFKDPATARSFLEKRLSIKGTEDLLGSALHFGPGCALLHDPLNNKMFLSRKNNLAYEIDDEYADWKNFLLRINNSMSTREILEQLDIHFEKIEEPFYLSLKEEILIVKHNGQVETA